MSGHFLTREPKGFIGKSAWLVGGNLAARALTFATMPIITRLFAPEAFGAFAGYESLLAILVAVCHLRYPLAVYLPEERDDVDALAALSLLVVAGFALLTALCTFLFGPALARAADMGDHVELLWLLGPGVLLGGVYMLQLQLATREAKFRGLAFSRIGQATAERGWGLADGLLLSASAFGLGLARVLGQVASTLLLWRGSGLARALAFLRGGNLPKLREVAARYVDFPKYSPTALLQQGSLQLPVLFLTALYSPVAAGFYALSRKMLREPITTIGDALSRIYYEQVSALLRQGSEEQAAAFNRRFYRALTDLSLVPLLLLGAAGPALFGLVFGEQWAEAGAYARALASFYAVLFVSRPLSALFDLKEHQRARFFFDASYAVLAAGSLGLGLLFGGPLAAALCFGLVSTALYAWRVVWLLGRVGISPAGALGPIPANLLTGLPLAALVLFVERTAQSDAATTCAALVGILVHLAIAAWRDKEFLKLVRTRLAARKRGPNPDDTERGE